MILGIDIGTTNIEFALTDISSNDISLNVMPNPLSKYGLDVMTRISKANDGKLDEMSTLLRLFLHDKISEIVDVNTLTQIRIAANTTMVHILMNYDCTNLGAFPFSPVHIEKIHSSSKELNICDTDIPVYITPGLSAFVGGDIVSGLSIVDSCCDDHYLFIDLGTNAEMVLVDNNIAYITSAAAGPAFETCSYGHATDAIDGLVNMLDNDIIDETGLLCDEYFDLGYDCNNMHFSQKKIRDFQMAKSAIRTGIELLIKESGVSTDTLSIYIAGTFGANLNVANAIRLKMLPDWFMGRTKALGNTSLAGTLNTKNENPIFNKKIREIVLANLPDFNDCYIENMNF